MEIVHPFTEIKSSADFLSKDEHINHHGVPLHLNLKSDLHVTDEIGTQPMGFVKHFQAGITFTHLKVEPGTEHIQVVTSQIVILEPVRIFAVFFIFLRPAFDKLMKRLNVL